MEARQESRANLFSAHSNGTGCVFASAPDLVILKMLYLCCSVHTRCVGQRALHALHQRLQAECAQQDWCELLKIIMIRHHLFDACR